MTDINNPPQSRPTMRILVILDRPGTARLTLETTDQLARRLGNVAVRVLHPALAINPDFQTPDEGIPSAQEERRFARSVSARADTLREIFHQWQASLPPCPATEWVEISGDVRKIVAAEAMSADMTILSRPCADDPPYVAQAFSGALYDAGTAVLISPLQRHHTTGGHPVIAWHPSPALERAIASAAPFLHGASHLTIIIGEDVPGDVPDPPLARALRDAGVDVHINRFMITSADVGEEIRHHALAAGGDLLIMGAYGRPHFIEWLFGGPTQDIFAHATLPILTHH